jgi:hypothetical protein
MLDEPFSALGSHLRRELENKPATVFAGSILMYLATAARYGRCSKKPKLFRRLG